MSSNAGLEGGEFDEESTIDGDSGGGCIDAMRLGLITTLDFFSAVVDFETNVGIFAGLFSVTVGVFLDKGVTLCF